MDPPLLCGALSLLYSCMLAGLLKGFHQATARLQLGNSMSQMQYDLHRQRGLKTSMQVKDRFLVLRVRLGLRVNAL